MKLAKLLQSTIKLHVVMLACGCLSVIVCMPILTADIKSFNELFILWAGGVSSIGLGGYIIFGAVFGVWVKRWTITRIQIMKYFFKTGEQINSVHNKQFLEVFRWCEDNTPGFIHVRERVSILDETGFFFFKQKTDRLFFKMVWG